jgi:hypothetical protein
MKKNTQLFYVKKNRMWSKKEKKNTCELGWSTTRGEPGPSLDYMNGIMELINLPLGQFSPELEFLDINLTKDSSLLLHDFHSPFYLRFLKKTILHCGFKKSGKQEN